MTRLLPLAAFLLATTLSTLAMGGPRSAETDAVCAPGLQKTPVYYSFWGRAGERSYADQRNHPLLDGAVITPRWRSLEPRRGEYDWSTLDEAIATWTRSGDPGVDSRRKAIVRIVPYSTWAPVAGDPNPNGDTPTWVYRAGVPAITFPGGRDTRGATVTIPKVWDQRFHELYGEFLGALGERYGEDRRVEGFQIGVGFLGTVQVYYAKGGNRALRKAGWSPRVWEEHTRRIVDLSRERLGEKPLYMRMVERFKHGVRLADEPERALRIAGHAVRNGISLILAGASPGGEWYAHDLIRKLGRLDLPGPLRIGFADDCPFYAPNDRRCNDPRTGAPRDARAFEAILDATRRASDAMGRDHETFYVFQRPETMASNRKGRRLDPEVHETALRALCREAAGEGSRTR